MIGGMIARVKKVVTKNGRSAGMQMAIITMEDLDGQIDAGGPRTIAVVYGAMHMRAVLRHLIDRRGFTSIEMEWMTVFAT